MGTRIKPITCGDNCWCHPRTECTPANLYVYFWEIVKCPTGVDIPNMHVFTCFQDGVDPCIWRSDCEAFGWKVTVYYLCGQNQTAVYLTDLADKEYFFGLRGGFAAEHDIFENQHFPCHPGIGGEEGNCFIFWMDKALDLINDLNIPDDGNTFLEIFVKDDVTPVYKFCNVKFGLNQKILLE